MQIEINIERGRTIHIEGIACARCPRVDYRQSYQGHEAIVKQGWTHVNEYTRERAPGISDVDSLVGWCCPGCSKVNQAVSRGQVALL
jgi:hypothetical protein